MVLRVVKFIETESRMVVARGWREGRMGSYCLMGTEFLVWDVENVLEMHNVMTAQQCDCPELYT